MKNKHNAIIICSRCQKNIEDEANLMFDEEHDFVPVHKTCMNKTPVSSFLDANQRQLDSWNEGHYK